MQKKYPYIKIDRQDITKQEKKEKKIKESEGFIIKEFNIWCFDKESEDEVIKLSISESKISILLNRISLFSYLI